jgi:hypothetical protein
VLTCPCPDSSSMFGGFDKVSKFIPVHFLALDSPVLLRLCRAHESPGRLVANAGSDPAGPRGLGGLPVQEASCDGDTVGE